MKIGLRWSIGESSFFNIYLFFIIYLAVADLRCGTRDLQSSLWHVGYNSLTRD